MIANESPIIFDDPELLTAVRHPSHIAAKVSGLLLVTQIVSGCGIHAKQVDAVHHDFPVITSSGTPANSTFNPFDETMQPSSPATTSETSPSITSDTTSPGEIPSPSTSTEEASPSAQPTAPAETSPATINSYTPAQSGQTVPDFTQLADSSCQSGDVLFLLNSPECGAHQLNLTSSSGELLGPKSEKPSLASDVVDKHCFVIGGPYNMPYGSDNRWVTISISSPEADTTQSHVAYVPWGTLRNLGNISMCDKHDYANNPAGM